MGNQFTRFKSNRVAPANLEETIEALEQKVSNLEDIIRNLNFMIQCLKERSEINSKIQGGIIQLRDSQIAYVNSALVHTREQLRAALHIKDDNGPA